MESHELDKCQNIIEFEITNDTQKTRTLFYM